MLQGFLILFRETLEAALVVGVVLGYLVRTGHARSSRWVWSGVATGAAASVAGAFLFRFIAGGFTGRAEQLFEGITMLAGAALLTTVIFWAMRKRGVAARLEQKVAAELFRPSGAGLLLLVFLSVLREGIESVLFLGAAALDAAGGTLLGAALGIAAAVLLGVGLFRGFLHANLRTVFTVSSLLLILFAAGLFARGVHELQEAGLVPALVEHLWDLNPAVPPGGGYPLLHDHGAIGGIFRGLFGYSGDPSLVDLLAWLAYLTGAAALWRQTSRVRKPG